VLVCRCIAATDGVPLANSKSGRSATSSVDRLEERRFFGGGFEQLLVRADDHLGP
jgi:hypothetical protein